MNSFLLWWSLLSLRTKVYAIIIFGTIIFLILHRGKAVVSHLIHSEDYYEIEEIQLSPGSAYDFDCVPESGKSCP
ncbi:hypothetical protein DLM75_01965 [Leptospira stimsonii]|uniref:Uncharacterized protein n=1 Tax=Leptospira stimsonii TaxID=2202203 RepID=A0A396Z9A9_9LEPT|nr:hypothetical protein DLM75_01965 [Leptospira stimsonii]